MNGITKIICENCEQQIIIRYLQPADVVKCPNCGSRQELPEDFIPNTQNQIDDFSTPGYWKPPANYKNNLANNGKNKILSISERQEINDKYIPKFFWLFSYIFLVIYINVRSQSENIPSFVSNFISGYFFQYYISRLFVLLAFIAAISILILVALQVSDKWWQMLVPNFKFNILKIQYLKPIGWILLVLVLFECIILIYTLI